MSVPGSNLLAQALSVIQPQTVTYYEAVGRYLNDVGQDVTQYAPPVAITGSLQAVAKRLYEAQGLDWQKDYFILYSLTDLIDVQRDVSGDVIIFNDHRYNCESSTNWFQIDGWLGMLVILTDLPIPVNIGPLFGFSDSDHPSGYVGFDQGYFSPGPDG